MLCLHTEGWRNYLNKVFNSNMTEIIDFFTFSKKWLYFHRYSHFFKVQRLGVGGGKIKKLPNLRRCKP